MKVVKFLDKMRGLMNLRRYQNIYLFKQRSVAEHSWSVSMIAHSLAQIEIHQFNKEVDIAKLLQKAISHDLLEVYTGDILSHTKRRTASMIRAVATLEKKVFNEEFSNDIPEEWQDEFRTLTLDAKDDSLEGDLLHASDTIDTLFEALEEIKLGNKEYFLGVMQGGIEKLMAMEIDSVQYFLKGFIDMLREKKFNFKKYYDKEFLTRLEEWEKAYPYE